MSQFQPKRSLVDVVEKEKPRSKRQRRSPKAPKGDDHSDSDYVEESETESIEMKVPSSIGKITAPVDFAFDYTIDEEWVSATATKNYLLKDPLLDYLAYYYNTIVRKRPDMSSKILGAIRERLPIDASPDALVSFSEFLMHQGKKFEKAIYTLLFTRFNHNEIVDLGGDTASRSHRKFQDTIDAMKNGTPIIINAVLHDPETKTYGIADLIVRSDYLRRIIDSSPLTKKEERIGAPLFEGKNYHYRVIDVKFSTLYLRSDGIHLCNPGSIPAFKGQVYIYNRIVAKIQGYDPCVAYILGRRWKYTKNQQVFSHSECFNRLGVVDFAGVDYPYVARVQQALDWIRDMRTHGEEWDIFSHSSPLPREELYPNMKHRSDHPWHDVKEMIADDIKDLTMFWMVGPKNRALAHSQGIYEWTDPRCTAEALGITGEKRARTLDALLDINREEDGPVVQPIVVTNNVHSWKKEKDLEFFVDFETGPDVCPDFAKLPDGSSYASLTMIGVGYICPEMDTWIYQDFTVNQMTRKEEKRICREFAEYISEKKRLYSADKIALYHWSKAEPNMWNSASERHGALLDNFWYDVAEEWSDLLDVFHAEPIVIRGCFSFCLKEVSKALHQHGLIKTLWDKENPCSDGPMAMVMAHRASEEAKRRAMSMRDLPLLKQIREYNEVDCRVMADILHYLRQNHMRKKKNRN